jgi:hypothetical protein
VKDDILDIVQKIQEARNPKYFLWNIIKDVEWFASEKYTNYLIGKKNDFVYFNYNLKNHTLFYDYKEIYNILITKYHLNELEANELVSGMVSEHFKLKVDTTRPFVINELACGE